MVGLSYLEERSIEERSFSELSLNCLPATTSFDVISLIAHAVTTAVTETY